MLFKIIYKICNHFRALVAAGNIIYSLFFKLIIFSFIQSTFLYIFPVLDLLQLGCLLVLLILAARILISFYVMLSRAEIFGEWHLCLLISLEN